MSQDQSGAPGPQAWVPGELPAPLAAPTPEPQPMFQPPSAFVATPQPAQSPYGAAYPGAPAYPSAPAHPGAAGQPPYGQPGYYRPPVAPRQTPTLAILGLVLAFFAPLIGLVLSIVAVVRAKADGNGRGLAIAALVVNIVLMPILAAIAIPVFMHQRELAQEAEVRDAFGRITTAIAGGDCDAYLAGSTFALQQQAHATTCAQFDAIFAEAGDPGAWLGSAQVTDVRVESGDAWVTTMEGVVVDETARVVTFEYWMVREDGAWLLNSVSLLD